MFNNKICSFLHETVLPNDDLICLSIPYFSKIGVTPLYNLTIDDLPGAITFIYSLFQNIN